MKGEEGKMKEQLDDIERVLDYDIKAICKGCAGITTHWACVVCRAKADAAIQKYQEWMAKQYEAWQKDGWEDGFSQGMTLGIGEGKRVGLADAESRVKAREREIVEWLENSKKLPFHWQAATELKLWLLERGKE